MALLRKIWVASATVILLFALVAPLARAGSLEIGDRLERLELVDRKGGAISPAELAGKVVILDFWASWCAPCRPTLGALEGLARRYGDAGLVVLAVSADEDRDDAESFIDEHFAGSTIRFVFDPGNRLLASVGADGLPALYLLDAERVVRMAKTGFSAAEVAEIENRVASLVGRPRQRLDGADLAGR